MVKIIRILEREIIWGMRLLGVRRLEDLTPEMVRTYRGDSLPREKLTSRDLLRRSSVSTGSLSGLSSKKGRVPSLSSKLLEHRDTTIDLTNFQIS